MKDHLESVRKKVSSLLESPPPLPWHRKATLPIGGLRAVGFDRDSDLLLIVSSQGRGVVDCLTAELVARDEAEYFEDGFNLEAGGIGPLQGKTIRIAGLCGGGLLNMTKDGWAIEGVTLDWPSESVLLVSPGSWLYGSAFGKPDNFVKLRVDSAVRAKGFSPTGLSLVIATESDVEIITRESVGSI